MAKLGTIGFGGGSALIPLFERELVHDKKVMEPATFTRDTVVANVTPGGLPTKLAALSGLRLAGIPGAVLGGFVAALPGTIMVFLLIGLVGVMGNAGVRYVEYAAVGISAYVVVVLIEYTRRTLRGRGIRHRMAINWAIAVLVGLAMGANTFVTWIGQLVGQTWETSLPQLSSVAVVVIALAVIIGWSMIRWLANLTSGHASRKALAKHTKTLPRDESHQLIIKALLSAAILAGIALLGLVAASAVAGAEGFWFMVLIALSIFATFGGGNAYIAVGSGFFVLTGYIGAEVFYGQLVPFANATPGPLIMKLSAEAGWEYGSTWGIFAGVVLAICGLVEGVAVSNLTALLVFSGYERYSDARVFRDISTFILPVICGMLLATALDMAVTAALLGAQSGIPVVVMAWAFAALVAVIWWVERRIAIHDVWVIVIASVTTLGGLLLAQSMLA